MNRCRFVKELSSYVDNQLPEKLKAKLEEHLKGCEICSQELNRLKTLSEKLKTWQAPVLDAGFDSSVMNEIVARELERGEVKMEKNIFNKLVPVASFAVVLIVAILGLKIYTHYGVQRDLMEGTGQFSNSDISNSYRGSRQYVPYSHYNKQGVSWGTKGINKDLVIEDFGDKDLGSEGSEPAGLNQRNAVPKLDRDLSLKILEQNMIAIKNWANSQYQSSYNLSSTQPSYSLSPKASEGSAIVIQPLLPTTAEGEKIIRTGNVRLEVENGQETYKKISQICQELKGYLAASRFYRDSEDRQAGSLTLRIPKDKFSLALEKVSALGKVKDSSTDSRDVGQEYVNLKSQLDASMIVYNKMLEALQKRQTTIPEAMRLESELTPILRKIEDLKNKIEYLNNAVSFTTITVDFYEAEVSVKALKESGRFIRENMINMQINAIKLLAAVIPVVILLVVSAVIAIVLILIVKYGIIRLFKR